MRQKKRPLKLRFHFTLYLFSFMLVISLSFLLLFSLQLKNITEERLLELGESYSAKLASDAANYLFTEMYPSLSEIVKSASIHHDILSVEILDRSSRVVAATDSTLVRKKINITGRRGKVSENREKIAIIRPVDLYGQHLGYVILTLSKEKSNMEMNRLYKKWFIVTFLIVMASFILSVLASKKITSPLNKILIFTEAVKGGDYSRPIEPVKSLELNLIAQALTSMAKAIMAREEKTKTLNNELSSQNALLTSIINGPPGVNIWSVDKEYRYTFFNNAHKQGMKEVWDADIEIGKSILDYLPTDYRKFVKSRYDEDLTGKVSQMTEKHTTLDGRTMFFKNVASSIYNIRGEVTGMTAFAINITEQKKAENKLKNTLKEKEILLKEVHHRVKNNLQIIASLLNIQRAKLSDLKSRQALTETINRVMSIALIHEQLYSSGNFVNINIRHYLDSLLASIQTTFYEEKSQVKIITELEDVYLNLNQAVSLGLICNEVITNSFKHAFEGVQNPVINIKMHMESNTSASLKIEDNGNGYNLVEKEGESDEETSIGTTLIEALTDQIGGIYEIKADENGTIFLIHIPIKSE